MSVSSRPAHVSTRLAIGLLAHGSILICSPKNSSRLVDTFFRNPCILVSDTETQISVNGVAQGYIRERERSLEHSSPPWFSLASTQRKGEWEARPAKGKVIRIRRCPWTIQYRKKWKQHSQQLYWTTGRFVQCKKEGKCGNVISKDRLLWMIIALFCFTFVNRMKEITPKAPNAIDTTAFSQLHCLYVAVIWPFRGSIIYLVP